MIDSLIWLFAALAAVGCMAFGRFWGRAAAKRGGKEEAERDAMQETIERVGRGRAALRNGRNAASPADRLHDNDGAW